jgi:hypothetical protein
MRIGPLPIKNYVFPGRAGELQRQGAIPALVRELGDNYALYHDALVEAFDANGGRPDPSDFDDRSQRGGSTAYLEAYERARDIVLAEALIRNCRAFRKSGRSLTDALDTSVPLLDAADRLVSVE